jgi:Uma2 family endonuclease
VLIVATPAVLLDPSPDLEPDPYRYRVYQPHWDYDEEGYAYGDGQPLEHPVHGEEPHMLRAILSRYWHETLGYTEYCIGVNMFLHYARERRLDQFCGPDLMVIRDVPAGFRRNWVIFREGKGPQFVYEVVSETSEVEDMTVKKLRYENVLRVPEYFWHNPETDEWGAFRLGLRGYEAVEKDRDGRIYSQQLGLHLGLWYGEREDRVWRWLRFWLPDGTLLPTPEEAERERADSERGRAEAAERAGASERERAEAERERAESERERAEAAERAGAIERERADAERERAESERARALAAEREVAAVQERAAQLAARLRALGIEPE